MRRSDYNFFIDHGTLVLQDKCGEGAVSLTNNMENVLVDIQSILKVDLSKRAIIYRDTDGVYDMVEWDGDNIDIIPLREFELKKALERAHKRRKEI